MTTTQNNNTLERALTDLVGAGRLWASHGLKVGKMALESSAKTLEVVAANLGELAEEFNGEVSASASEPAAPASEPAAESPEVAEVQPEIPENLDPSTPECDNQLDESDADSSRESS